MLEAQMRILLVDDDRNYVTVTVPDLRDSLQERELSAEVVPAYSVDEGIEQLQQGNFHLAVIDLRFEGSTRNGNEIIKEILETQILPIIVLSGYRHELKDEYGQHGLIYNTQRKHVDEVVEKILEWNQRDVFSFFSETGFLNSALRMTFQQTMWNHVSRYWKYIDTGNSATLDRIAGRIAATLLYDVLASTPEYACERGEVRIHHGEIYIFDTPRNHLAVGDILDLDNQLFVALSPSCDLVIRPNEGSKAHKVLLARCHDFSTFVSQKQAIMDQCEIIVNRRRGQSSKERATDKLVKLMRQDWENPSGLYFFLPPFAHFGGGVVDFLNIRIESYGASEAALLIKKRVMSLNREMAAELASRFARYMTRLGQPTYDTEALIRAVANVIETPGLNGNG